jgi:hypothetical protein
LNLVRNVNFERVNWNKVLRRASVNRVAYLFALNLMSMPDIPKSTSLVKNLELLVSEGQNYIERLRATLRFISASFSNAGIPFLIVKTYKALPYVTLDVDVLVKLNDFEKAENVLRLARSKHQRDINKSQSSIFLPGLLRIDLHKGFFWQGCSYLDSSLPWVNTRNQEICGVTCPVPSLEIELLLAIAHTIGERLHVPYLEFLFVKSASQKAHWKIITSQAEKYCWRKSLLRFVSIINMLNCKLYPLEQEPLITLDSLQSKKLGVSKPDNKNSLSMPYMYPLRYTIETFRERWKFIKPYVMLSNIAYYLFATARYYYSGKLRVPIYDHWFDFERIQI